MKTIGVFETISRSYTTCTHSTSGNTQWLIEEAPDCFVISIRGTELRGSHLIPDFLCNALSLIPWYNRHLGWGSFGYMNAAIDSVNDIYHYLESHGHLEKPIIFAGHSMGGAISYMCARIMSAEGVPIAAWVGAGVVNCMISVCSVDLKFKCFNYRYEEDIISIFPPRFLGFKQPSPYLQIGDDNTRLIGDIEDHRMDAYLAHAPSDIIL